MSESLIHPECRGTKKTDFDQGFSAPSATRRCVKKFDFLDGGSMVRGLMPDWRWHTAVLLVREHRAAAAASDQWLMTAVAFLERFRAAKSPSDVGGYVARAYELYERDLVERHRLEAGLLTRESDEIVAEVCKLPVELVEAYRKIFFDIESVAPIIIDAWFRADKRLIDPETQWKYAAWGGGMGALKELWHHQLMATEANAAAAAAEKRAARAARGRRRKECDYDGANDFPW